MQVRHARDSLHMASLLDPATYPPNVAPGAIPVFSLTIPEANSSISGSKSTGENRPSESGKVVTGSKSTGGSENRPYETVRVIAMEKLASGVFLEGVWCA